MKFHVERDHIRMRYNVFLEVSGEDGRRFFQTRGNDGTPPEVIEVPLGMEPPLWDWFPYQVAEQLGELLAPRPQATERHLDDAIGVRDRLLSLVELVTKP